jgi:hypothetical protein
MRIARRCTLFAMLLCFAAYLWGQTQPAPAVNPAAPASQPPKPSHAPDNFPMTAKPMLASQLNGVFYVDGFPSNGCTVNSVVYTTQLDCAVASIANWLINANSPAVLMLGQRSSGTTYDTCTGITIPQVVNRSMSLIGSGSGGINQSSTIRQVCPIKQAMLYKAPAPDKNLNQSIRISGIKLQGNGNASSCMDIDGLQGSIIENIYCNGSFTDSGGEDAIVTFGDNYATTGWLYETTFRNITVTGAMGGEPARPAIVTAVDDNDTIASDGYKIKSAGAGYSAGAHLPIVYLWGFGAGAAPCRKMPTDLRAIVANGGIQSITSSTPAEGCSGRIDVEVMNDSVFTYGIHFRNVTDSETENLVVRGAFKGASIAEDEAPINNLHAHVYSGQYISFKDNGGEVWDAPQIDTPGHIGFYINGPGTTVRSPLISGNGDYPSGIGVLLGPKATETNLSGAFFCYPNDKSSNWTKIATVVNGAIANGLPAGIKLHSTLSGSCDTAASPPSAIFDSGFPQTGAAASPYVDFESSGATVSQAWSAAGTYFGINSTGSFNGNFLDFRKNGAEKFSVGSDGTLRLIVPPDLPLTYKVGENTLTQPSASGTIALTSQLPLAGTTVSWNNHGAPIAGNSCVNGPTARIEGATSRMAVVVTPSANPGLGLSWTNTYLSTGTTIQVVVCNLTAAPIVPMASSYNVRMIP